MRDNVVHMNRRDDLDRERLGPVGRAVRLLAAALLIGQAFFIEGAVTLWHSLAVVVGAFLAIEALVGWGPLAALHALQRDWRAQRRAEKAEQKREAEAETAAVRNAPRAQEEGEGLRRAA